VIAFNRVGCVDQTADIFWELEEGSQLLPVLQPGLDRCSVPVTPNLIQPQQVGVCFFTGGCLVDLLEIGQESFVIFPAGVFQRAADLLDDTALYLCFGEDCLDSIWKTGQPIDRSDEDILYAASLQIGDHREPEIGPLRP